MCEGLETPAPFELIGYADSNFAGGPEDRKSVMGYCFFMAGALLSWSSKKQGIVPTPIIEAEYLALGHASREGVRICRFLNEMALGKGLATEMSINGDDELRRGEVLTTELTINGDESSLSLTKNPEGQSRTKHIDVQHHYIRELINEGELIVN